MVRAIEASVRKGSLEGLEAIAGQVCVLVFACVCVCVCVLVFACVCVCVCVLSALQMSFARYRSNIFLF